MLSDWKTCKLPECQFMQPCWRCEARMSLSFINCYHDISVEKKPSTLISKLMAKKIGNDLFVIYFYLLFSQHKSLIVTTDCSVRHYGSCKCDSCSRYYNSHYCSNHYCNNHYHSNGHCNSRCSTG